MNDLERLLDAALDAKLVDGCPCCGLDGDALLELLNEVLEQAIA